MLTTKLIQASIAGVEGYTRTFDFNFFKLTEEVGELAVEIQVAQGKLPSEKGGKDGVVGEAIDVALCALDIAFLQLSKQGIRNIEEMEQVLNQVASTKLARWEKKLEQLQSEESFL